MTSRVLVVDHSPTVRRALSAGYQLHVAKPVAPAELVAAVRRVARPDDF